MGKPIRHFHRPLKCTLSVATFLPVLGSGIWFQSVFTVSSKALRHLWRWLQTSLHGGSHSFVQARWKLRLVFLFFYLRDYFAWSCFQMGGIVSWGKRYQCQNSQRYTINSNISQTRCCHRRMTGSISLDENGQFRFPTLGILWVVKIIQKFTRQH